MEERYDNRRDHVLRGPIETAINITLKNGLTPEAAAEMILQTFSEMGLINYAPRDGFKFLTPAGRVLVSLMEKPDTTMRELAVYLGITESAVMKYISTLLKAGFIARTKVKGRNTYRLNLKEVFRNPDIVRFYNGIQTTASTLSNE